MKKVTYALIILFMLVSCTSEAQHHDTNVFAAASLSEAFTEMKTAFEAHHSGHTIILNFAGSQTLRAQIEEGAPADVYASANQLHMDSLVNGGLIEADAPVEFATNEMMVIVSKKAVVPIQTLTDMMNPETSFVIGTENVPHGNYTRQVLTNLSGQAGLPADFYDRVMANVVSEENDVRTAVSKVNLGEVDFAILFKSSLTEEIRANVNILEIPQEYNVSASYPIAILKDSPDPTSGKLFIDFVLSSDGQAILEKWGFGTVTEAANDE